MYFVRLNTKCIQFRNYIFFVSSVKQRNYHHFRFFAIAPIQIVYVR